MKISTSTIPFILVLTFFGHTASAAETAPKCDPIQHLSSSDATQVTPEILRRSYEVVRERMGAQATDESLVLRYPLNAEQSRVIGEALFDRWGLDIDAADLMFSIRLGPQRTQLLLTSGANELVRLDYMMRDGLDSALVFASMSLPDGQATCVEHMKMQQFLVEEVIAEMVVVTYPEGFPAATE